MVDYNKTDVAPPGCKIISHEKLYQRRTWAPYRQHGYFPGTALHHYRCQKVYISSTASERIVDTLEIYTHNYPMPQISSTDILIMDANDMTDELKHPHPDAPFAQVDDDTLTALARLEAIFKQQKSSTTQGL
jgi:hypothetical protein